MTNLINKYPDQSDQSDFAIDLNHALSGLDTMAMLERAINKEFVNQIALTSSFGADSAILLHMVSVINTNLPVVFLDTDRHFFQTLQYRDQLVAQLGLTKLVNLKADSEEEEDFDPKGNLWQLAPDACCTLRKVRPLNRLLKTYEAWITGRKRHQGEARAKLPFVEWDGRNYKINPLANWTSNDVSDYIKAHNLPVHPLVDMGYPSIGCYTCTKPVEAGDDVRSGRWSGVDKSECGIHRPFEGGDGI